VFDDFAHHPTAIRETVRAVRRRFPDRRLWAVLEPRSWSMRRNVFQERLPEALSAADEVLIASVYGAEALRSGERLDPEAVVARLAGLGRRARFLPDARAIVEVVSAEAASGDVVVVMSNGAFDGIHDRLLRALAERTTSAGAGGR
jgi:UDP-N-acetylmuramate: L-alanyl-gamma-D-glutamyl-meso-diaminopimelate ligase